MNISQRLKSLILTATIFGGGLPLLAQDAAQSTAAADNTGVNQRDKNAGEPTADRQPNSASDRDITQRIRQAIVKDKSLSTYAHNIKIITQNGQVTLKGPVRTEEEKRSIEAKAADVAGQEKVISELDVKPKS